MFGVYLVFVWGLLLPLPAPGKRRFGFVPWRTFFLGAPPLVCRLSQRSPPQNPAECFKDLAPLLPSLEQSEPTRARLGFAAASVVMSRSKTSKSPFFQDLLDFIVPKCLTHQEVHFSLCQPSLRTSVNDCIPFVSMLYYL